MVWAMTYITVVTSRKTDLKTVAKEKKMARVKKQPIPRIPRKSSKSKGTFPNMRHPKTGPTETEIIAVLTRTHGMLSKAARILGCDRKTISNRLKEFPSIGQALEESEARRLDEAETMLDRNIAKGEQRAIEFFLSKKGRLRGYGTDSKDKDDEIDLGKVVADWQAMLEETKPPSLSNPSVLEVGPKK